MPAAPAPRRWLVVGGGTAGCIVARGLARAAGNDVVLIERGAGTGRRPGVSTFADLVEGGPWEQLTVTDDRAPRAYPLGSGLGGTSRLNGAVVGIGPAATDDANDLHDVAHAAGATVGGRDPEWTGELVADDELGVVDRALLDAAPDAGKLRLLRRDGRLLDVAAVTGLDRTDEPGGPLAGRLELRTGSGVRAVEIAGGRARGLLLDDGERLAGDAVVLCAGAIRSAELLLRAGVQVAGLGAVRQHAGRLVDLVLHPHAEWRPQSLVSGVALRRGAAEVLALNHLGAGLAGHGALLVGWLAGTRRGSITVADDPRTAPAVDFGVLAGTPDAAGLAAAEVIAEELLDHPAFAAVAVEHRRSPALAGYFHAGSSCARGTVLDDDNRVVGHQRLFVADAAALPDLPVRSTMLTAVIAEASRFAARWRDGELD